MKIEKQDKHQANEGRVAILALLLVASAIPVMAALCPEVKVVGDIQQGQPNADCLWWKFTPEMKVCDPENITSGLKCNLDSEATPIAVEQKEDPEQRTPCVWQLSDPQPPPDSNIQAWNDDTDCTEGS